MSMRPSSSGAGSSASAPRGSIYNAPLEMDIDLWNRLSGSPDFRASTPSQASSALARSESMESLDIGEPVIKGRKELDSVVHVHEVPGDEFAYAYFERDSGARTLVAPNKERVNNFNPVVPRVVLADAVFWQPLLTNDGRSGHRFQLFHNNEPTAHLEVFHDTASIQKITLFHGLYTKLAHTAKLIDKRSIVSFTPPQQHIHRLHEMLNSLNETELYLPVNEVVVGRAMQTNSLMQLQIPHIYAEHPISATAQHAWAETSRLLSELSSVVVSCVESHNYAEFQRVGLM
jgi:hypothetical protein